MQLAGSRYQEFENKRYMQFGCGRKRRHSFSAVVGPNLGSAPCLATEPEAPGAASTQPKNNGGPFSFERIQFWLQARLQAPLTSFGSKDNRALFGGVVERSLCNSTDYTAVRGFEAVPSSSGAAIRQTAHPRNHQRRF